MIRQTRLITLEGLSRAKSPPERFRIVIGLESRYQSIRNILADHLGEGSAVEPDICERPLNWNVHLSPEGAERMPFDRPLPNPNAYSSSIVTDFEMTFGNRPDRHRLPLELQLRVLGFCLDDRKILLRVRQTSSFLRAVVSKIIFSDPYTYYSVDASWLLLGGHPGHVDYSMSFLPLVQRLRIRSRQYPLNLESKSMVSRTRGSHAGKVLEGLLEAYHGTMQLKRSLYRLSSNGEMEVVAPRRLYQTVLIPMRTFDGPVGQFEKVKYLQQRIEAQRRGLGLTMIEALEHQKYGNNDCAYCSAPSMQPGEWTLHAVLEHAEKLIPGDQFEQWPPELRNKLAGRNVELLQMSQKNHSTLQRIQKEWEEATYDKRARIKEAWMQQLRTDPDWDTGVPAESSPLWTRFENWMRERERTRELPKSETFRWETGECTSTCPRRHKTSWIRFKGC